MKKKYARIMSVIGIALIIAGILWQLIYKPPVKYRVSFNTDGGSSIEDIYVLENTSVIEPRPPIKKGHKFIGWYYQGREYDFANKVIEDIVLDAQWININFETENQ